MLDRASVTPLPPVVPPLARIRLGSIDDAKKARAVLQQLLAGAVARSVYLETLAEVAQRKQIHRLLTGPDGAYFADWASFVTTPTPWGLGVPLAVLDAVVRERTDPKAMARRLLKEDVPGQQLLGRQSHRRAADPATAGTPGPPPGSGRAYWLARLRRDRVDLLQRVEQGELSPLAAAVEAGWTSPLIWCRRTPESFAAQAVKHLSGPQLVALVVYLQAPERIPHPMTRRRGGGHRDAA